MVFNGHINYRILVVLLCSKAKRVAAEGVCPFALLFGTDLVPKMRIFSFLPSSAFPTIITHFAAPLLLI